MCISCPQIPEFIIGKLGAFIFTMVNDGIPWHWSYINIWWFWLVTPAICVYWMRKLFRRFWIWLNWEKTTGGAFRSNWWEEFWGHDIWRRWDEESFCLSLKDCVRWSSVTNLRSSSFDAACAPLVMACMHGHLPYAVTCRPTCLSTQVRRLPILVCVRIQFVRLQMRCCWCISQAEFCSFVHFKQHEDHQWIDSPRELKKILDLNQRLLLSKI